MVMRVPPFAYAVVDTNEKAIPRLLHAGSHIELLLTLERHNTVNRLPWRLQWLPLQQNTQTFVVISSQLLAIVAHFVYPSSSNY